LIFGLQQITRGLWGFPLSILRKTASSIDHTVSAVKEIEGNHHGENLAALVMEVIKDWEIFCDGQCVK
jgi:hypothetical protein